MNEYLQTPYADLWNKAGFILCMKGTANLRINDRPWTLSPGMVLMVSPLISMQEFSPDSEFEIIHFLEDLQALYAVFHRVIDSGFPIYVRENPLWHISEQEKVFLDNMHALIVDKRKAVESLEGEERKLNKYQLELLNKASIMEIIQSRLTSCRQPDNATKKQVGVTYGFIQSLQENYTTQREVAWYASQANMSAGHFTSVIKRVTGRTPSKWIEGITINNAKLMLELSDKSIKEIATALNFPEQFTFRKYFKQHAGVSPSVFRKTHLKPIPS